MNNTFSRCPPDDQDCCRFFVIGPQQRRKGGKFDAPTVYSPAAVTDQTGRVVTEHEAEWPE